MKMKYTLVFLVLAFTAQTVYAVPILYTDRSAWQAAVGSLYTEDFESDPGGFSDIQTPYTTANGFTLTGVNSQFNSMQILPSGEMTVLNNGTQFLHFRDFTAGLQVTFPGLSPAFGFDYGASDPGWVLTAANGISHTFSDRSTGFIGFIDTMGTFSSFTLTGFSLVQGGFSVDNISIVPVPAAVWLFGSGLLGLLGVSRGMKAA